MVHGERATVERKDLRYLPKTVAALPLFGNGRNRILIAGINLSAREIQVSIARLCVNGG